MSEKSACAIKQAKRRLEILKRKRAKVLDKPLLNPRVKYLPSPDEIEKMKQIIRQEWQDSDYVPPYPQTKTGAKGYKIQDGVDSVRVPKVHKLDLGRKFR